MKKLMIIGGASALVLFGIIFGAFFAGPMIASASSKANGPSTTTTNKYCEQYQNDLAHRLGISANTLQQDQQSAREDVLAQLVKDGKLTQQQADKIKQGIASHKACNGFGKGEKPGHKGHGPFNGPLFKKYLAGAEAQVAQGLHMTPEQLTAQIQAGKSLNDIATTQHVSSSQLQTIMTNALQSTLKQAVSAGDITQDQANKLAQQFQQHPELLNKLLNGHVHKDGKKGGMGGMMPGSATQQ